MRITNSMMANNFLRNLNNNIGQMGKYQYQLATGKRMTKLSDDPVGVLKSMQARVRLCRLNQHRANVDTAQEWLTQAETSVLEANKIVVNAHESVVQAANSYMNPLDKQAVGVLIGQLRDHILNLGNSTISDRYIFGGFNTVQQPFAVDSATGHLLYNGLDMYDTAVDWTGEQSQVLEFEIGFGMNANVTFLGTDVMGLGEDNIYKILDDLHEVLMRDAPGDAQPDEIAPFLTKLHGAQDRLLALASDVGGRTNRLDLISSRYEDDFLNYSDMKSKIEDVDEAEAIMNFKMSEALYLSALNTGSRIIQPSLLDYLR